MKIHINNGCDKLKSCLLCYPANYRITNKFSIIILYNQK